MLQYLINFLSSKILKKTFEAILFYFSCEVFKLCRVEYFSIIYQNITGNVSGINSSSSCWISRYQLTYQVILKYWFVVILKKCRTYLASYSKSHSFLIWHFSIISTKSGSINVHRVIVSPLIVGGTNNINFNTVRFTSKITTSCNIH